MHLSPRRPAAVVAIALLAVPTLLPFVTALVSWTTPAGDIWLHQLQHVLPRVAVNTVALLVIVAAATAILGTTLGWLVAGHDFPGRSFFSWGLLLPLAVPGYVLAVVFAGALDYSGPLQSGLRVAFGDGLRLPPVRSLGGAALVLTLTLYPYVYMLARIAFETAGERMLEAAQSLGLDRRAAFRRLLLPMARPAVAAGTGLVCMETLADFGVVSALNVDTLTTAIYRAWFGMFSVAAALQMAAILGLLAVTGLWLERHLRGDRGFATQGAGREPLPRLRLDGVRGAAAAAGAGGVLALAFFLPLAQLLQWAMRHAATDLDARYWAFAGRSLAVALSGALVVVIAALVHAYALRHDPRRWLHALGRLSTAGYAIPGTVLAVGLFAPVATLNGWLQDRADSFWGSGSPQIFLQGTLFTMFAAYLARFLAVGAGPIGSGLERVHRNLDDAAEILGVRGGARLRRVHLPLLRGSLLAAAVLVFVDLMKELPITLMTRPFGFETLAVRVFEMTAEGEWTRAALPSVLIVAAGILPVILLARRATHVA